MVELSEAQRALLQGKNFAHVATVNESGQPQVTPVWVDVEDGRVVFNTATGRLKWRNLQRDPRVALEVQDPDDPYRYLQIQGTAEMTEEGADEQIDMLARKYRGIERYDGHKPGERRVKVYVTPTKLGGRIT